MSEGKGVRARRNVRWRFETGDGRKTRDVRGAKFDTCRAITTTRVCHWHVEWQRRDNHGYQEKGGTKERGRRQCGNKTASLLERKNGCFFCFFCCYLFISCQTEGRLRQTDGDKRIRRHDAKVTEGGSEWTELFYLHTNSCSASVGFLFILPK